MIGVPLFLLSLSLTVALLILDLRKRYSLFNVEQHKPGEVIFREGDLADRVYFIVNGTVEVVRTLEGKEIVELQVLGKENFARLMQAIPAAQKEFSVKASERLKKRER